MKNSVLQDYIEEYYIHIIEMIARENKIEDHFELVETMSRKKYHIFKLCANNEEMIPYVLDAIEALRVSILNIIHHQDIDMVAMYEKDKPFRMKRDYLDE